VFLMPVTVSTSVRRLAVRSSFEVAARAGSIALVSRRCLPGIGFKCLPRGINSQIRCLRERPVVRETEPRVGCYMFSYLSFHDNRGRTRMYSRQKSYRGFKCP
jgi:hypothetical protein